MSISSALRTGHRLAASVFNRDRFFDGWSPLMMCCGLDQDRVGVEHRRPHLILGYAHEPSRNFYLSINLTCQALSRHDGFPKVRRVIACSTALPLVGVFDGHVS